MYYVYVLRLKNRTYYTGFSSNLKKRIKAHIEGEISQTRDLCPLKLVFYAAFASKVKALYFEK
ncbi:hypothetical protein CO054_03215, partial [Candidatus Shapirobacteria bacterium CG_4_9_14_0_2_um_filter_39_11]